MTDADQTKPLWVNLDEEEFATLLTALACFVNICIEDGEHIESMTRVVRASRGIGAVVAQPITAPPQLMAFAQRFMAQHRTGQMGTSQ